MVEMKSRGRGGGWGRRGRRVLPASHSARPILKMGFPTSACSSCPTAAQPGAVYCPKNKTCWGGAGAKVRTGESAVGRRTERASGRPWEGVCSGAGVPRGEGHSRRTQVRSSEQESGSDPRFRFKRCLAGSFLLQTSRLPLRGPQPALGFGASKTHLPPWGSPSGGVTSARQWAVPALARGEPLCPGSSLHSKASWRAAVWQLSRRPEGLLQWGVVWAGIPPQLGKRILPGLALAEVSLPRDTQSSALVSGAELPKPGRGGRSRHGHRPGCRWGPRLLTARLRISSLLPPAPGACPPAPGRRDRQMRSAVPVQWGPWGPPPPPPHWAAAGVPGGHREGGKCRGQEGGRGADVPLRHARPARPPAAPARKRGGGGRGGGLA